MTKPLTVNAAAAAVRSDLKKTVNSHIEALLVQLGSCEFKSMDWHRFTANIGGLRMALGIISRHAKNASGRTGRLGKK